MPWLIDTGTVYGKRYHTVAPPMFNGHWDEMIAWCEQSFGPTGSLWHEAKSLTPEPNQRWYANNAKFWFVDEKDLNWFMLKWGDVSNGV